MTGWILFAALAGLLVGFSSGIVIGIKSGAKAMTKEIERLLSEEGLELKGLK